MSTQIISIAYAGPGLGGTYAGLVHHYKLHKNRSSQNELAPNYSHLWSSDCIGRESLCRHIYVCLSVITSSFSHGGPPCRSLCLNIISTRFNTLAGVVASNAFVRFRLKKNKQVRRATYKDAHKQYITKLTRFSSSILCMQYGKPCVFHQFFTSLFTVRHVSNGKF
jgi:hypothetical protein